MPKSRHTYGVLNIAKRHPRLFQKLTASRQQHESEDSEMKEEVQKQWQQMRKNFTKGKTTAEICDDILIICIIIGAIWFLFESDTAVQQLRGLFK